MAAFLDLCRFVPTAGGTTDWTYSSTVGGCQSPAAANTVNGTGYRVYAVSNDLTQWEISQGAYNSGTNTFPRTVVLSNSSGTGTATGQTGAGTKINFSTVPQVSAVALAEDLVRAQSVIPCGRLTLTSGTPVTTSDVTGATTVYFTPYEGNVISLWNGLSWVANEFTELSLSLSGLTANTNYDVVVFINGGAISLATIAWTNDTTRASAIAQQNGIDVISGTPTQRLLGTIRITSITGQCEDSVARRYVSNRYNDTPRPMAVNDPAVTWSYGTATFRQANANTANQLDYVCCVGRPAWAVVNSMFSTSSATVVSSSVGIGIDSTSGNSAITTRSGGTFGDTSTHSIDAAYYGTPGVGRHTIVWLEKASGTGGTTQTFYGTNAGNFQLGIIGGISN